MINLLCHFIALSYQDVFQRSESHDVFCSVQMKSHILLDTYTVFSSYLDKVEKPLKTLIFISV